MSAGNPSSGGVVVPVHADFGPFDAQVAAKRAQGITISAQVTAQGGGGAAAAIAQAQSAAVTPGQSGFTPPAPGIPSLANIGGTPSFAGGMSSQLATALQTAAQAITAAAQQISQAATQQAQAAKAVLSDAQAGGSAPAGAGAAQLAASTGPAGSPTVRALAIPGGAAGFANRLSLGIGGAAGVGAAIAVRTGLEVLDEKLRYQNELRGIALNGGSAADVSRFALEDVQRRRSIPSTAWLLWFESLGGSGKQISRDSLRYQLNQEEFYAASAYDTARGQEFESGQVRFRREQDVAERLSFETNPFGRELTQIRAASKAREQSIRDVYNRQRAAFPDVPGNEELTAERQAARRWLGEQEEADLETELGAREKNPDGSYILNSDGSFFRGPTGRRRAEIDAAISRFTQGMELRRRGIESGTAATLIGAGLTRESYGQSRGTREALAEIESIAGQTEASRYEAIQSGQFALIPAIAAQGRARLLALRQGLTASSEGIEVNPFRQSLSGVGTFNLEAVQKGIGVGMGRAASESTTLPRFRTDTVDGPNAVAMNTAAMNSKLDQIYNTIQDFVQKVAVA